MTNIFIEKDKPTINEWLENLPSRKKTAKIDELAEKCERNRSTVYKWRQGMTKPHPKLHGIIENVAGIKLNFN